MSEWVDDTRSQVCAAPQDSQLKSKNLAELQHFTRLKHGQLGDSYPYQPWYTVELQFLVAITHPNITMLCYFHLVLCFCLVDIDVFPTLHWGWESAFGMWGKIVSHATIVSHAHPTYALVEKKNIQNWQDILINNMIWGNQRKHGHHAMC